MAISVGNSYSEDNLMHTFLENSQNVVKYYAQIASDQAELIEEEKFADKKPLSISDLEIYF